MKNESEIITQVSKMLIPFIWVFGIYIVLGGADSVGGGSGRRGFVRRVYAALHHPP